jgi:hypothetical protein
MMEAVSANDPSATLDKIAEAKKKRQKPRHLGARQPFFIELSRLMVVAIKASSGQLVYKAQTKPNGPWQANWMPVDTTQTYGVMTTGITGDGRIAVVAQPSSPTALFYIDETPDTVGPEEWNAPVSLGKPAGVNAFAHLAMAVDADARLEIFGTDTNGGIWWKYQNPSRIVQKTVTITPPGTKTPITVTVNEIAPPLTPWSDWMQLPGGLTQIIALRNADGRIILFGIGAANHLYRSEQRVAQALQPSDWSGWVQMDIGTSIFVAMALTLDSAGAVNFFGVDNIGDVLHTRQSPPCTSTWTGWARPGIVRGGAHALAVGIDGDDRLVLVATDKSNFHNMNAQLDVETQQWSGWNPFSTGTPTRLALDYNSDGRLTLFSYYGKDGQLWCISQVAYSSTEWELAWTELAPSDIRQFVVVRDPTPPAATA